MKVYLECHECRNCILGVILYHITWFTVTAGVHAHQLLPQTARIKLVGTNNSKEKFFSYTCKDLKEYQKLRGFVDSVVPVVEGRAIMYYSTHTNCVLKAHSQSSDS